MDSLATVIKRCNVHLKLDNPTEGFGNCFPNAIIQQCRRPEVKSWLQKNRSGAIFYSQQNLRMKVTHFAMKSREKAIINLKTKYEQEIGPVDKKTWQEYWNWMAQDGTWVDHIFIQMIAWYMDLDIHIITTSSKPESPFIIISGNTTGISGPPLLLGNYTNVHYQSLLQNQGVLTATKKQEPRNETEFSEGNTDDFIFIQGEVTITFKSQEIGKLQ